jgi:DNA-binding response OmpR family regulator
MAEPPDATKKPSPGAPPAVPSSGVVEKPLEVIVVDDDPDTRELIAVLFESQRWLVRAFAAIDAAQAAALANPPDVLITDLELVAPGDGLRLARALRAHPRTRSVALILVTGHEVEAHVASTFDAHARKPVEPETLVDMVKTCGALRRAERARAAVR